MKIPREDIHISRFLTAMLVHFIRENSEGLIRFNPLRSPHSFLDEKWMGVEFSSADGVFSPKLLVSDLLRELIVRELIRQGVTTDSGFEFEMESGFSSGPVRRRIKPVSSDPGESPRLDFVITKPDPGEPAEIPEDTVYVLRVTAEDRLPLGLKYLRDLAIQLELREIAVEFENASFPLVLLGDHLLTLFKDQPTGNMLHILPTTIDGDEKTPILTVVTQAPDGSLEPRFNMMSAMSVYLFPYLKTLAGLDPDATPPVEGTLQITGYPEMKLRFENLEGRQAVTFQRQ